MNSRLILEIRKLSLRKVKCPIGLIGPEKVIITTPRQALGNGYFHISSVEGRRGLGYCLGRGHSFWRVFLGTDRALLLHDNNSSRTSGTGCFWSIKVFFSSAPDFALWSKDTSSEMLTGFQSSGSNKVPPALGTSPFPTCCPPPSPAQERGPWGEETLRYTAVWEELPLKIYHWEGCCLLRGRAGHTTVPSPRTREVRPMRTAQTLVGRVPFQSLDESVLPWAADCSHWSKPWGESSG